MLAAYVPDFQIEGLRCGQFNGSDVLADRGDGFEVRVEGRRELRAELFEESGFAGVVEAQEENGVFY